MKVAITGATGVIGIELMSLLQKSHIDFLALTRKNYIRKYYITTDYSIQSLKYILDGIDIVVHLAATREEDISLGYKGVDSNVEITENILKAMSETGVRKLIYLSSISVYSDLKLLPWKETQAVTPKTFYGLSKLTCEYLCRLYESRGIQSIIFRCAHVLVLENRRYMISRFLNSAAQRETLCVIGKSLVKREFIYVKDVARAILWAIYQEEHLGIFNLGTGIGSTNLEIAETINLIFGNEGNLEYRCDIPEGIDDSFMCVDLLRKCGFETMYDLESSIKDIYKNNFV